MSLAISVIPRYHLNLERTEMDVRRWPIDRPLPATVIDAVSPIFEVMGFLPVALNNGITSGRDLAAYSILKARRLFKLQNLQLMVIR